MNGGTRLRLHRSGMTHSINVLHAVAESACIGRVGAPERRFAALAVYGLARWLEGRRAAGRVRDYRSGLAWFKAWLLRT